MIYISARFKGLQSASQNDCINVIPSKSALNMNSPCVVGVNVFVSPIFTPSVVSFVNTLYEFPEFGWGRRTLVLLYLDLITNK